MVSNLRGCDRDRDRSAFEYIPFGTAESEAVGELTLQGIPKLRLFFLGKLKQRVVKVFELLVLLLQRRIVAPGVAARGTTTAATAATATAILSLSQCMPGQFVSN